MTDNRTTELLPCPFCGGEPEIRERKVHHTDWFGKDYRLMYRVRCTKCGAAIGGYSPVLFHRDSNGIEHGAGVDWNTRTPEQAIAATLGSDDRYDAGFANGVQAVFQQLEGIEDYEELQCFIAEYWGEGEGYDER